MTEENKETELGLPYLFQTKVTQQGIITIPHILKLKTASYYLFNFKPLKGDIIYTQIKKLRHSNQRQYISCRIQTPFMQKGDEVEVTIVKEFKGGKEFIIEEDEGSEILSNQTVRCVFLYFNKENLNIITSEDSEKFLSNNIDFLKSKYITNSINYLSTNQSFNHYEENEFFDVLRDKNYSIIRFVIKKRLINLEILQREPTEVNKEAYDTLVPVFFLIITRTDYLQFILTEYLRTRSKLFLDKYQSISSYSSFSIREFESLIQNEIFEIIAKSDESSKRFNSIDDPRFWFFIPSEFHFCVKKLQMGFYSGKDYIVVEELIESMKEEKEVEDAKQLVVKTIEWLYKHQAIKVNEKDGRKIVEMYKLE